MLRVRGGTLTTPTTKSITRDCFSRHAITLVVLTPTAGVTDQSRNLDLKN